MPDGLAGGGTLVADGVLGSGTNAIVWKSATGAFAFLWLLTLFFYFRRVPVAATQTASNGSVTLDEKALLKQLQQACQKGNAPSARKDLAQWIRNYAPRSLRGSMRDFGANCGDKALEQGIAELDSSGFADEVSVDWDGAALWSAFKDWNSRKAKPAKNNVGESPELYVG